MNNQCVIVIPIYKENLTSYEKISLMQCEKRLKQYKKIFIMPENLDYSQYSAIADGGGGTFSNRIFSGGCRI